MIWMINVIILYNYYISMLILRELFLVSDLVFKLLGGRIRLNSVPRYVSFGAVQYVADGVSRNAKFRISITHHVRYRRKMFAYGKGRKGHLYMRV